MPSPLSDPARRRPSFDLRRLAKHVPFVVLCGVLAAATAYLVSSAQPKRYTATATLQVPAPDVLAQLNGAQFLPTDSQIREASTVASLITQPAIAEATSRQLGARVTPDEVAASLEVQVGNEVNLVTISATLENPRLAAQIATTTANTFVAARQRRQRVDNENAQRELRRQLDRLTTEERRSATGRLVRERLRNVQARAATGSDVSLVQAARVPGTASTPLPARASVIGLVGGLLLGLAISLLRVRLVTRVRTARDFEQLWPLPLVGPIARGLPTLAPSRSLPASATLEAFGSARAALRNLGLEDATKTVVVTSALPGEGKSTAVWHLAVAAAVSGARVLVVEADLRTATLSTTLDHSSGGLTNVLLGTGNATQVLTSIALADASRNLEAAVDVIFAGATHPSPSVLLERPALQNFLEGARSRYDLVLIDAPDVGVGDALLLLRKADASLVVFRPGRAHRQEVTRMRALLDSFGTPVIAALVNGERT